MKTSNPTQELNDLIAYTRIIEAINNIKITQAAISFTIKWN